jgi:thiamine pyrophosphate-dependent acetolactate synthase large subunit-like protein
LGVLVTLAQRPAANLTLVITENGTYEVTGSQPVPGADFIDYEQLCRGAGLQRVYTIDNDADFDAKLDQHFSEEGPVVFIWKIDKAEEPVPKPSKPIRERAHRLREALTGSA